MKLTRNRFRLKCGVALVLLTIPLLPLVNWAYVRGTFSSPVETRRQTGLLERRETRLMLAAVAVMIFVGVSLCVELPDDPPARKDPWDEEPNQDNPS